MLFYTLSDENRPVAIDLDCPQDAIAFTAWKEQNLERCRIALDHVGPATVSTVFLGIDHGVENDQPILWETMVFGTDIPLLENYTVRYISHDEAVKGHYLTLQLVKGTLKDVS